MTTRDRTPVTHPAQYRYTLRVEDTTDQMKDRFMGVQTVADGERVARMICKASTTTLCNIFDELTREEDGSPVNVFTIRGTHAS